jgi:DNA polymerase III subunit delta
LVELPKASIYLLHGDDEYALDDFLRQLTGTFKSDSAGMAELNTVRLDGRQASEEDLNNAVSSLPFFVEQRLVVVRQPLAKLASDAARQRFLKLLEGLPTSTTLALVVEDHLNRKDWEMLPATYWLVKWAVGQGEHVVMRGFPVPDVKDMPEWVRREAVKQGGQFNPAAAATLASRLGSETRQASQEITKLLTYVDYARPVEARDVELLTPAEATVSVFDMVDSLAGGNSSRALRLLHSLLEEQDPQSLFGMVVRQFRLLLQTREVLDEGGNSAKVASELRQIPFVADKLSKQAQRFKLSQLEKIYHRLLEIDEESKTSQSPLEVLLDTFVAELGR